MTAIDRAMLQLAVELSHECILFVDCLSMQIVDANAAACRLFGYQKDVIRRRKISDFSNPLGHRSWQTEVDRCIATPGGVSFELSVECQGNVHRVVDARLCAPGSSGILILFLAKTVDAEEIREASRDHIQRDPLTMLPDRSLFECRLASMLEQLHLNGYSLAVLMIDIDNFKLVNDRWGHVCGDVVLREVARRLEQCIRHNDVLVRFGGDEFVAIIDRIQSPAEALGVGQRMSEAINTTIEFEHAESLKVSASVGIAVATDGCTVDKLLDFADQAMYEAKNQGRNGQVVLHGE